MQLELQKEKIAIELKEVSQKVTEEISWFQQTRKRDLKQAMGNYVRAQICFYERVTLFYIHMPIMINDLFL